MFHEKPRAHLLRFNNFSHIICHTLNMMEDDFFQIITNGRFTFCHSLIACIINQNRYITNIIRFSLS